ncbi:hypothetical protein B0A48_01386 [Cryoendolithus antarcticus]|uniref:Uncharacterized protein n=1 Tax=Cryoendolithus antarcticus TaxID=1507870 RepID=A0A1V8TT62_9PEZI|nr:hypothetical protein B0A48_01386 [Cryoendolithus antarcticus]
MGITSSKPSPPITKTTGIEVKRNDLYSVNTGVPLHEQPWADPNHLIHHKLDHDLTPVPKTHPNPLAPSNPLRTAAPKLKISPPTPKPSHDDPEAILPVRPRSPEITTPAPPPQKHRLSALIDLDSVAADAQVRSPSGHLLTASEAKQRDDWPKSVRERKDAIRRKVSEVREREENEGKGEREVFGHESEVSIGEASAELQVKEDRDRAEEEKRRREAAAEAERERRAALKGKLGCGFA